MDKDKLNTDSGADTDIEVRTSGNTDDRNNNQDMDKISSQQPNVEKENNEGIGDSAVNDEKLTNYTSNRSADA